MKIEAGDILEIDGELVHASSLDYLIDGISYKKLHGLCFSVDTTMGIAKYYVVEKDNPRVLVFPHKIRTKLGKITVLDVFERHVSESEIKIVPVGDYDFDKSSKLVRVK